MHFSVLHLIATYGYVGLFFGLVFEFLFLPVPGETVLMLAGAAWGHRTLHFIPLMLSVSLGTFFGSLIAFGIGRFLGRTVVLRIGRVFGVNEEKLRTAEQKFERYTLAVLLFSRFIPGVRVLIPYVAGINGISVPLFCVYSIFGSVVWSIVFLLIGRFLRNEWSAIHQWLGQFAILGIIVLVVAVIAILFIARRRARTRRTTDSESR